MSRTSRALRFVLGLTLVAGLGPASVSAAPAPPPRAERPTYSLGEKWIRDDGVYELIRIEGDRYVFSAERGLEIHLSKDLGIAKIQKGASVVAELDPPLPLPWPLEVGKWGATSGSYGREPFRLTWSIDAYEEVHIPPVRSRPFGFPTR